MRVDVTSVIARFAELVQEQSQLLADLGPRSQAALNASHIEDSEPATALRLVEAELRAVWLDYAGRWEQVLEDMHWAATELQSSLDSWLGDTDLTPEGRQNLGNELIAVSQESIHAVAGIRSAAQAVRTTGAGLKGIFLPGTRLACLIDAVAYEVERTAAAIRVAVDRWK